MELVNDDIDKIENENDNDNDGVIDGQFQNEDQELIGDANVQQELNGEEEEEDSNSDKRFPELDEGGYINWFCKVEGNEYFVEIDEDFIRHTENLIGIKYKDYIETLLSPEPPNDSMVNEESLNESQNIKEIYGLIHKRFITTTKGLALMREKYLNGVYGRCPRILCNKQVLLPIGLSDELKYSRVKVFCPICQEVYKPTRYKGRSVILDGAYFGTSFPQIFLAHYPDLNPKIKKFESFIPKLYGFKLFGKYGSKYYTPDRDELKKTMKKLDIKIDNDDDEEEEENDIE